MNNISKISFGLFLLITSQPTFSADFTTTTLTDEVDINPGDGLCVTATDNCSLRAAIQEANTSLGPHTITLQAGYYYLTIAGRDEDLSATGDLDIISDITITGAGAANTIISANAIDRVFEIAPNKRATSGSDTVRGSKTILNDLSVAKGHVQILDVNDAYSDGGLGGGIYNNADLYLNDVWVYDNRAMGSGGGIYSQSSYLELNHSLIYRNMSTAGSGLSLSNGLNVINNSFIVQNSPPTNPTNFIGGGIFNFSNLTIRNSVIYENTAQIDGAGIYHGLGALDISNTTISHNIANRNGGGIFYRNGQIGASQSTNYPSLTHVTITDNIAKSFDTSNNGAPVVSYIPNSGSFTYPDGSSINFEIPTDGPSEGQFGGGGIVVAAQTNYDGSNVVMTVVNSIVSNNYTSTALTTLDDCGFTPNGSINSLGGNLDSDNTCGFTQTTDLPATDPLLIAFNIDDIVNPANSVPKLSQAEFDLLQPHTQTVEITSPVIDKAVDYYCTTVDQPNRDRPTTLCDIGAFELLPPTANPMQYITQASGVIQSAFNVSYVNALNFSYEIVTQPTQGNVGLELPIANGVWTYSANSNASGNDTFTYRTCLDDSTCSAPATIGILFTSASQVTNDVSISIIEGTGSASPITVVSENELIAEVADVDYTFPLGAFFFDIEDVSSNVSGVLSLTMQLPADTNIPVDAKVRKLDNTGTWRTLQSTPSTTISYATIDSVAKTITLNLIDNDMFDSNPTVNIIRDPVALGIPSTGDEDEQTENIASDDSSSSGGSIDLLIFFLFCIITTLRVRPTEHSLSRSLVKKAS